MLTRYEKIFRNKKFSDLDSHDILEFVSEFENKFKKLIGTQYAISVNSATAALHLALNAVGVGKNDEVLIPTNTFVATAEAVVYLGATPILCDIESSSHNINVKLLILEIKNFQYTPQIQYNDDDIQDIENQPD